MADAVTEIAPRVHRLGTRTINWYVVEDEDRLTVIDAGMPAHRPMLDELLSALGRSLSDVAAVVLTHPHVDHIGIAESLRREAGVPVFVHAADKELALEGKQPKRERSMLPYLRYPAAWRLLWELSRSGGPRLRRVGHVVTFGDGDVLDVPGRPRAVHTPGHSNGHCAFHLPGHGALFVGDALCTRNPLTGRDGPQLLPAAFAVSSAVALESLARLEQLDGVVLCGHGEPWREGAAQAVARAREVGPT
jgi:glyoxylase-like metal-dependent hydrolase (beta-lactamase superfamily II)